MDKANIINKLKDHLTISKIKHNNEIMKLDTLKDAHIYCIVNNISSQKYGLLLEKFIQIKFNYIKNNSENCIGDCSKDGKNCEIKVSLGGTNHRKFNYVQIRPSHDCDIYILTAYYLSDENINSEGELYIFKLPKSKIKEIIISYGGYAHGTIQKNGRITMESLNDKIILKSMQFVQL